MAAKQSKIEEKLENMVETNQSGRKQTKMTENLEKCGVLQIIFCQALISVLPSSHFCPAKLPFLSCQAPIFVPTATYLPTPTFAATY